jgi:hypothetical protein
MEGERERREYAHTIADRASRIKRNPKNVELKERGRTDQG